MSLADAIVLVLVLLILVGFIAGMWMMFEKANQPGWAALIPIYNTYVMLKVAGRPGWWLILYIVPIINWIVPLLVLWDIARNFGKGELFSVVTVLLGFPLVYLGFSNDQYQPRASSEVILSEFYDF